MEIKNMNKVNSDGKVKAFFTLRTPKMDINDMKLIEGKDGQLYSMTPSREYLDKKSQTKKYQSIVYITDETLRNQITELARQEYYKGATPGAASPLDEDIPF